MAVGYKARFGTKRRDELYSRERTAAHLAGRGEFPICVHCDLPVTPGQAWDEAHIGTPRALGGKSTGVGHRRCNHIDNNLVVTPLVAKAKRVRRRHLGIAGPGLGRHPLPGGTRSTVRKTVRGEVVPRVSLGERLERLRAKRFFFEESPNVD
jgi:hypothetical protein